MELRIQFQWQFSLFLSQQNVQIHSFTVYKISVFHLFGKDILYGMKITQMKAYRPKKKKNKKRLKNQILRR